VQTYTPDSYAIVAAAAHDYDQFFEIEGAARRDSHYPPFTRLARLLHLDSNHERGQRNAERLARQLRDEASRRGLPAVEIIGPAPPHVPKWHGRFRWQITIRAADPAELLEPLKLPANWSMEIDPVSLA
jgi:primosomal protein N' (replication factor Y)